MSVFKFELTEDHIKLVKQLKINQEIDEDAIIDKKSPFGGDSVYDDISLILFGKVNEVNLNDVGKTYNEEEKAKFNKLAEEVITALDIILYIGSFTTGTYVTRTYERDWKKI